MGHFGKHLEGETKSGEVCCGHACEQPVIIAFAPSKPVSLAVESHSGYDGKVDAVIFFPADILPRGFLYAKGTCLHGGVGCPASHFDAVRTGHYRQKHLFACADSCVQERGDIHLIGQRMIEQHAVGLLPEKGAAHSPAYLLRHDAKLCRRVCRFSLSRQSAQFLLRRHLPSAYFLAAFLAALAFSLSYFSQSFFFRVSCFCASVLALAAAAA